MKKKYRNKETENRCLWPMCHDKIGAGLPACLKHWQRLPKKLRDEIWKHFVPGQPTKAYLKIALTVQAWIQGYKSAKSLSGIPMITSDLLEVFIEGLKAGARKMKSKKK